MVILIDEFVGIYRSWLEDNDNVNSLFSCQCGNLMIDCEESSVQMDINFLYNNAEFADIGKNDTCVLSDEEIQ